jgi:hypothetical protein
MVPDVLLKQAVKDRRKGIFHLWRRARKSPLQLSLSLNRK